MARASGRRRERSVESRFSGFVATQGLGSPCVRHELIEAFCVQGLADATSATKGTYRSVLRRRAGAVLPVGRPRYRGAPAKAPYSPAERAELVSIARLQPKAWRGEAALMVLALGIGAGLRAGEIAAARTGDVDVGACHVAVHVGGPRARRVVVASPFDAIVAATGSDQDAHLFHPGHAERSYHNFVNDVCHTLVKDPGAPHLSLARCRASYVCDRLAQGVTLAEILSATGIGCVESLLRYAVHVEGAPETKAQLRRALGEGR